MKRELQNKFKVAMVRVLKLHEEAEPITFSRFGNDPSKSLAIPANMRKAKRLLRKAKQNLRIMNSSLKKWKEIQKTGE
jgi:hypothetical protein